MKKKSKDSITQEALSKIIESVKKCGPTHTIFWPLYIHHNFKGTGGPHFLHPTDGGYNVFKNDGTFQENIPSSFIESRMSIIKDNLLVQE